MHEVVETFRPRAAHESATRGGWPRSSPVEESYSIDDLAWSRPWSRPCSPSSGRMKRVAPATRWPPDAARPPGAMLGPGAERFGLQAGANFYPATSRARYDHTLLKPGHARTRSRPCAARPASTGSRRVREPGWVRCAPRSSGIGDPGCTVVGFPLGAPSHEVKAYDGARGVEAGRLRGGHGPKWAALKSGDYARRARHRRMWSGPSRPGARVVSIIEGRVLTTTRRSRRASGRAACADFVKTCDGFGPRGATAADVALMRQRGGAGHGGQGRGAACATCRPPGPCWRRGRTASARAWAVKITESRA